MSDLTDLLKKIDPSKTIDFYQSQLDKAINSFDVPRPKFENYEQLKDYLGEYLWHLECILGDYGEKLRYDKKSLDYNKGFCTDIFYKHYGGYFQKTTLDMANTGLQGGIRQLFKEIDEYVLKKRLDSSIRGPVWNYINAMKDMADRKKAVREYVELYGHILPPELLDGDNGRLFLQFGAVLENHPYMIRRMREIGRA